ncbi:MAG: hypothetical protein ACLQAT_20145 [Candidatus Binataceae bacterium]
MSTPAVDQPPRPCALAPRFENFPAELIRLLKWVLWIYELRDKKWTKPPFQPNGSRASSTDPATWSSFATVMRAFSTGRFDGVGFVLSPGDGLVGFDFDHCLDSTTQRITDPKIAGYVARLNSYTEISPSGMGLRVLARGTLPETNRRLGHCEVYDRGRYLTITGNLYPIGATPEC